MMAFARAACFCALIAAGLLPACAEESTDTSAESTCVPECIGRVCGDDGCGGICGSCTAAQECSPEGLCAARAADPACAETCSDLGYSCGDHCGEACGTCGAGEACLEGSCVCQPVCPLAGCGADDGCGSKCVRCPSEASCTDCVLKLSLQEIRVEDGMRFAKVALHYTPAEGVAFPRIADIRVAVEGVATLTGLEIGPPLLDAGKTLHSDPETGRPYAELPDNVLQVLIMSLTNQNVIRGGLWVVYEFRLDDDQPASFRLVTREETLAPLEADTQLWGAALGGHVAVWPEADGGSHAN